MTPNLLEEIVKHIGKPLEMGCKLILNILDVPTQKLGDLLGDQVSYWQWTNRLSIADKAWRRLQTKGVKPRPLAMDFSVPFLRESGDAGDDFLQSWWAELLASAVEDDAFVHIAFVNTLHSMSAADVRFLDALLQTQHVGLDGRIDAVVAVTSLSTQQAEMSFRNLERLGFFTPTGRRLKGFAFALLRACSDSKERVEEYVKKQKTLPLVSVTD